MSTRPLLYTVNSIDPILQIVGSRDSALVGKVVDAYRASEYFDEQRLEELRELIGRVVEGKTKNGVEPGEWSQCMEHAVVALGQGDGVPINEDWKWGAWFDYFGLLEERLPADALRLLGYLVMGRPFKGESVENDGSYHAWLRSAEVKRLLAALAEVQEEFPEIEDAVDDFHNELLGWLEECGSRDLLLLAS